jgi:hypothetical protein
MFTLLLLFIPLVIGMKVIQNGCFIEKSLNILALFNAKLSIFKAFVSVYTAKVEQYNKK